MAITVDMIKELREKTGSGMMDCKKALTESGGDMEKAIVWLREKGIASADKKMSRVTAEGIVDAYIHGNGRVGVLIEVNIETDFAAKNEDFRRMVRDIAMQIAAMKPRWVSRSEVPADELEQERSIVRNQALNEGKPEKIIKKMVEGRVVKFYNDVCVLEQPFVKDGEITVGQMIAQKAKGLEIVRFTRYKMGDGLEKRSTDLAAEVAEQIDKMQK